MPPHQVPYYDQVITSSTESSTNKQHHLSHCPTESGYTSGHGRALSAGTVQPHDTEEKGQFRSEGS